MSDQIDIRRVGPADGVAGALAEVLIDCLEGGASVSFMLPLEHHRAEAFWDDLLASASAGERIVLWPASGLVDTTIFYKDLTA